MRSMTSNKPKRRCGETISDMADCGLFQFNAVRGITRDMAREIRAICFCKKYII